MRSTRIYQYDELRTIPDLPGLYCWYLKVTNANLETLREYYDIFHSAQYDVSVKGDFSFNYHGKLRNQSEKAIPNDYLQSLDEEMLNLLFQEIAQPIYLGIAKTSLLNRISSHKRKIDEARFELIEIKQEDDEKDDNIFANRISEIVNKTSLKTSNLSVKIFSYSEGIGRDKIKSLMYCENYFNRIIKPILGKK